MYKAECRFCQFVGKGDTQNAAFHALAHHVQETHPGMDVTPEKPAAKDTMKVVPLHRETRAH
jgi:hypothetical protein